METRPSAIVVDELKAACEVYRDALALVQRLEAEAKASLVAEAGHPWIGKPVTAMRRKSTYDGGTVKLRGVVAIYDPRIHSRIRGARGLKPGEIIVLSETGKTIFSRLKSSLHVSETEWQLIEEAVS